jgi:hypothetical protein
VCRIRLTRAQIQMPRAAGAGLIADPDFAASLTPPQGILELSRQIRFALLNVCAVAGLVLLVGSDLPLRVDLVLPACALPLSTYVRLNTARVERRTEALTATPTEPGA